MYLLLREYQKTDDEQIVHLFYNTVHTINAWDYNDSQLNAWAPDDLDVKRWCRPLRDGYTVVADASGTIVGFASLEASGRLDRLFVHKDHQGKGIAKQLVTAIEEYAHNNGLKELTADVSITAKPFFLKQGYVSLRENTVLRAGQRLRNYTMRKTLCR